MPLAGCPRCKKMFNKKQDQAVCDACSEIEEQEQDQVREYVSKHPDSSPAEVAESLKIDLEVVMRAVNSGRIAQVSNREAVRCGRCGAPAISLSKKLCETCLAELNAEFAKQRSDVKLPPKKWSNLESGGTVRDTVEEKRKKS